MAATDSQQQQVQQKQQQQQQQHDQADSSSDRPPSNYISHLGTVSSNQHRDGHLGHHQCELSQRLRGHRRDSELWLSKLAHIWPKRQSPEWKPRRASVASCQRLQQHHSQFCPHQHRHQDGRKDSTNSLKVGPAAAAAAVAALVVAPDLTRREADVNSASTQRISVAAAAAAAGAGKNSLEQKQSGQQQQQQQNSSANNALGWQDCSHLNASSICGSRPEVRECAEKSAEVKDYASAAAAAAGGDTRERLLDDDDSSRQRDEHDMSTSSKSNRRRRRRRRSDQEQEQEREQEDNGQDDEQERQHRRPPEEDDEEGKLSRRESGSSDDCSSTGNSNSSNTNTSTGQRQWCSSSRDSCSCCSCGYAAAATAAAAVALAPAAGAAGQQHTSGSGGGGGGCELTGAELTSSSRLEVNRSPAAAASGSEKLLSVEQAGSCCCRALTGADSASSSSVSLSSGVSSAKNKHNNSGSNSGATAAAATSNGLRQIKKRLTIGGCIGEGLQFRDQHRKSLILSMALRQMSTENSLVAAAAAAAGAGHLSSSTNNNNNNNEATRSTKTHHPYGQEPNRANSKQQVTDEKLTIDEQQQQPQSKGGQVAPLDRAARQRRMGAIVEPPGYGELQLAGESARNSSNHHHQRGGKQLATTTSEKANSSSELAAITTCHQIGHHGGIEQRRCWNVSSDDVECWLDDHPSFVRDYFMRKANRQLIDDWLISNAKTSNLSGGGGQEQPQPQPQPLEQQPTATNQCQPGDVEIGAEIGRSYTQRNLSRLAGEQRHIPEQPAAAAAAAATAGDSIRAHRSNSQSAAALSCPPLPARKISATDFETRTGSGYLRPMVSRTPDGRPTFLSQLDVRAPPARRELFDKCQFRREISRSRIESTRAAAAAAAAAAAETNSSKPDASEASSIMSDMSGHDEVRLIFELVKNICNDLDIGTLLHKILKNIAVLINADKSSLFLVCGEPGRPTHLVSQLFNVDQESSERDREPSPSPPSPQEADGEASLHSPRSDFDGRTISIPWGTGLVGYVAASGESVNIANCYEDSRFDDSVDRMTGYRTQHMLCAPIFDKRNEIVGVAQVINKRDGNPFSEADELKFKRYLQFCGIGLRNAQSYENCQLENRRNQVILDLARMIFEEQSTIEQVVHKIMLHTQSLLECQRCQVLLIDDGSEDLEQLLQLGQPAAAAAAGAPAAASGTVGGAGAGARPPEWRPHCQEGQSCNMAAAASAAAAAAAATVAADDDQAGDDCGERVTDTTGQEEPAAASSKLFSLVFDLECEGNDPVMHSSQAGQAQPARGQRAQFPLNIGITGYVAMTGETLNIEDAHKCARFDPSVDQNSNFRHKSILCMPIRNGKRQIIGVSQLINKKNGRPFNKNDEHLFEAFAIFCGLGIHNTLMYEKVLKIMAKQRVTFEVLSYHATAPLEEAKKLNSAPIPSTTALNLTSLKFNDFSLDEQFMLKACLRFFIDLDLMRRFQIDQLVLCNWILSVQKNYRTVTYHPIVGGNGLKASPVGYHNWRHAFNVSQMMFAILINTQICQALGELDTLALLIACLCHDLDHRGTNNSFQIKSASPLAELYSTSTMEHHHFDQCVMILNSQGNQILANLSPEEYSRVIFLLEEAILATDLANYFQKRDLFFGLIKSNQFNWKENREHRSLLRCMLMTACDVAAITKPWPIQKVVADLVMSEFYQQGDIERHELHIEPSDLMNRENMCKLPEMQIGFIDTICLPIYSAFANLFPIELKPLLDGCQENRRLWLIQAANSMKAHVHCRNIGDSVQSSADETKSDRDEEKPLGVS